MNASNARGNEGIEGRSAVLAEIVQRFEDAWQRGERPSIADYLPADGPDRPGDPCP
jgi:hypothetical protein